MKISFQEQDSLYAVFSFFFFIVDTETHNDYVIAPVLFLAFIQFINKKVKKYLVNWLSYFPNQQDTLQTLLKQDETLFFLGGGHPVLLRELPAVGQST